MQQQYRLRSMSLAIFFAILGAAILVQIVRIQNSPQAAAFLQQGDRYAGEYKTLYPARGEIYDRDGHLLAGNMTVYEIGVNLSDVKNANTIALTASVTLGLDYNNVLNSITNPPAGQVYVVLQDFVPSDKAAEMQQLKNKLDGEFKGSDSASLSGLEFKAHLQRSYPEKSLVSNVLGFVTHEGRGYFGVEEKYNDLLAGVPVTVWVPADPNRAEDMPQVPAGATLILTIDREIQAAVEEILYSAVASTGSASGTIVVMDPKTGGILALASTPQMDLNQFWHYTEIYHNASEYDRAVSMPYEPGSVFKILTMAAALDTGTVTPNTPFMDNGYFQIGGSTIYNWDQGAWGPQDMIGCLQHSLNVCLAWVASQVGPQNFYTYMQRFGIGHPTGVDLAGEAAGRLKIPGDADWYTVDLGTNAFGQGVAVTPVQLMMAASAVANDGKMVAPHVLYGLVSNGRQYDTPTQVVGTPITQQTAHTLTEMLATSMERGESIALVPGYRIAGKTGTAQVPTPYGTYSNSVTNASFLGWGPVDNPKFMVYVWLEKPQTSEWAALVASPVFKQVVEKLVVLMKIPPDRIRQQIAGQ
jgi:cell division protein FtsI/penicillin-binding protein 2